MPRVVSVSLGLAVGLVGGIVFTHVSHRTPMPPSPVVQELPRNADAEVPPLESETPPVPDTPSTTADVPRPPVGTTDTPTGVASLAQEVAALRAKVMRLATQVTALQQRQAQQRTTSPTSTGRTDEVPPDPRRDFAARAAEEQARQHQIAMLEASFQREPANQRWAAEATEAVQAAMGTDPIIQNTLLALECRSTTCRVELADDDTGELGKALPLILQQLAPTLPSATADMVDHGTRGRTMVLYLNR